MTSDPVIPMRLLRSQLAGGLVLAVLHLALSARGAATGVFGKYPNLAAGLARGELSRAQVGDASPAYLLLNLLASPAAIRWGQWGLAGLCVALLFFSLHRLAGPLAAWLGAGLLATSSAWLVYSAVLEPDLLIGVCLLVAAAALTAPPSRAALLVAAAAIGAAVSLRPTALIFAVLTGLWLVRQRVTSRAPAPRASASGQGVQPVAEVPIEAGVPRQDEVARDGTALRSPGAAGAPPPVRDGRRERVTATSSLTARSAAAPAIDAGASRRDPVDVRARSTPHALEGAGGRSTRATVTSRAGKATRPAADPDLAPGTSRLDQVDVPARSTLLFGALQRLVRGGRTVRDVATSPAATAARRGAAPDIASRTSRPDPVDVEDRSTPLLLAALTLTLAAAALPSALLHLRTGHDLRGTMSAGQVFHQSHRPESVGFGAVFPSLLKIVENQAASGAHAPDAAHELYRAMARADEGAGLDDVQTEGYWFRRTLTFFREEPMLALRQEVQKLVFFVAPPVGEYDIPAVAPMLDASPGLPLRWLGLLAAGALLTLGRRRLAALAPWVLLWVSALCVALLFYFHGRYAVGLVPALAALAGAGLARLLEAPREPRRLALFAAPCLVLLLPSVRWSDRLVERLGDLDRLAHARPGGAADPWMVARANYVQQQAAMPDVFWPTAPRGAGLLADDPLTSEQAARLAAERYGTSSPVDATLAAGLQAAAGHCPQALALLAPVRTSGFAWANGDVTVDPLLVESDCLVTSGRRAEAVLSLEAANRSTPGRLEVLARLVAAADTGAATELARWEHELFALHDGLSAHLALARARLRWGDPQGALADADWIVARWAPAAPFAEVERAIALEALARPLEARDAWKRTLVLKAPVHGEAALDGLADSSASEDPRSALSYWRRRGDRPRVQALLAQHPEAAAPRL